MKLNFLTTIIMIWGLAGCSGDGPVIWTDSYDISVMSFNLRYDTVEDGENQWDNRKEACLKLIRETNPSIFGIQEGLDNQVAYLDDSLPEYSYVGVGRDDGESSGEYSAIYYDNDQFELIESQSFWLSETPEMPSLGWDANNIRIVTWAHLKDLDHNKSIFIFNTHFDHKGKTAREESAKLLVEKIGEIAHEDAPVFVTGDFNALIGNAIMEPITEAFLNARSTAEEADKKKSFNNWGNKLVSRNIDFIFYNHATALAYRTVTEDFGVPFVSDHYPLIAHFDYE